MPVWMSLWPARLQERRLRAPVGAGVRNRLDHLASPLYPGDMTTALSFPTRVGSGPGGAACAERQPSRENLDRLAAHGPIRLLADPAWLGAQAMVYRVPGTRGLRRSEQLVVRLRRANLGPLQPSHKPSQMIGTDLQQGTADAQPRLDGAGALAESLLVCPLGELAELPPVAYAEHGRLPPAPHPIRGATRGIVPQ